MCQLVDDGDVLDDVVVVRIPGGDTPTAEISTHGGVRIAQRALMLLERCGAQVVDAGQFVSRSVTAHPIEHDCDGALLCTFSRRLTQWLLAQRRNLPPFLKRFDSLDSTQQAAFRDRSRIAVRLIRGLHVAIVGPPNVGKSTLANRLIGRDRVITSDQPGTTRDWVSETALIRGWPVTLTDTAGIRDTRCDIEVEAIRRARRQAGLADIVVIVLDATTTPNEQSAALQAILETTRPTPQDRGTGAHGTEPSGMARIQIVVLNKCDATDPTTAAKTADSGLPMENLQTESLEPLPISALTGAGVDDLESGIHAMLGLDHLEDDLPTAFLPHQLH